MAVRRPPSRPPSLVGFTPIRLLGSGGYADVFLYEQHRPRREVAVKVLLGEGLTEEGRRQFGDEADLMAQLSAHPSIVTIYGADIAPDGRPFLVMEYYPGPNLSVRARAERMGLPEVLRIGVQVSAAVETAHQAGILHRDIKPANILTSRYHKPGLTDFGISVSKARPVGQAQDGLSVPWAPPEAFDDAALDERSDLYSLGATVYTLLVGRSPFERPGEANSPLDLMARIQRDPLPPTGRTDVPAGLERLLAQAMAKRPLIRPESALSFARALQQLELDLALQPTALDVIGDLGRLDAGRDDDGEDSATRLRAVTIDPQPPAPARPVPPTPAGLAEPARDRSGPKTPPAGETRLRPAARSGPAAPLIDGVPDQPSGAAPYTRHRSRVVAAEEMTGTLNRPRTDAEAVTPPGQDRPSRARAPVLAAAAVVLVAAVALVGFAVLRGGEDGVAAATDAESAASGGSALADRPASPTKVRLARSGPDVTITWVNPDPEPGDTYQWWRTDRPRERKAVDGTRATMPDVPADERPCVQVVTVRDALTSFDLTEPACLAAAG